MKEWIYLITCGAEHGKGSSACIQTAADNIGRSSGTTAYYRKRQITLQGDQGGQIKLSHFYGPPGTGKTTLAKVIANTTSAEFTQINATTAGKKIWKK